MSVHTRFAQVACAGAQGYAQVIHRYAQTAHNPRRRCAQEYPQSLWITVVHARSPEDRPLVICLLRPQSEGETLQGDRAGELISYHRPHGTHPVLSGERGEPWVSAFAPDAFADLWTRADSLRPADLAMLFHGTVADFATREIR